MNIFSSVINVFRAPVRATSSTQAAAALGTMVSVDMAMQRFGWLGDYDEQLAKIGISRAQLRALEADDEITAALESRRDAAVNTPWRFEHPQARTRKFFTDAFAGHMHALLTSLWLAVPYGYGIVEAVYAAPDAPDNPTPGRISIANVLECPFEWFRVVPGGEVRWRDYDVPVDTRKFFACVRGQSVRKPMGDALLAKAYWPWFFRTHGWKFWAKFLEQAGNPLLYGKTQGDKQAVLEQLQAITTGPVIVVGDMDDVAAVDVPGNSPNKFTEFEVACCRRIQRLILGQTLTSGTDGGSGNRALGEVHQAVLDEKKRADVLMISQAVQRMTNTLAALNGMDAPTFVMEDGHGLEMERAQRDQILTESGILKFTTEYLREKYGFEESDFDVVSDPVQQEQVAPTEGKFSFADGDAPHRPEFTPGQQAIEDEIDRTLQALVSPISQAAMASAIRNAESPEDLYERLAVVMRDANGAELRKAFERAMFAADIMGYAQGKRG